MKKKELVQFSRTMASMLNAKLSTPDALTFYAMGGANENTNKRLRKIITLLENGVDPASAFRKSGLFDDTFCALIDAGAKAGSISNALSAISKRMRTEMKFSSKIKKAVSIPLFAGGIAFTVFIAAQVKLVPMIEKMIKDVGQEPDTFSGIVFKMSHFVQAIWIYAVLLVIALITGLIMSLPFRQKTILVLASRWKLLRRMVMGSRQLTMLSTLHMLYSNHLSISESLRITARVLKKTNLGPELVKVAEATERGVSINQAMKYAQVDQTIPHMLLIGEKSSSVAEQLKNLSEMYEEEVENVIDLFTQIVSTLSIFVVMSIIGFVFTSAYLPVVLMGPKMMNASGM